MDNSRKPVHEAVVDGRDALFVLIVRPNPDDKSRVRPEMHDHGLGAENVIFILRQLADAIERDNPPPVHDR